MANSTSSSNRNITLTAEDQKFEGDLNRAARSIKEATALIFTSGAGLGVDSGLPDFRGPQGFWKAYPPMQQLGLQFHQMSNPSWFKKDPSFAWGFFGHRYELYCKANPHQGYHIMKNWGESKPYKYFVFTSNVDGHWIKCGVEQEKVNECHGSIHYLQCANNCSDEIWHAAGHLKEAVVNLETFKMQDPLPQCKNCKNSLSRPNILMFDDYSWVSNRQDWQEDNFNDYLRNLKDKKDLKLVVVEVGAGEGVPTVRQTSESICRQLNGQLIRINIRDPNVPSRISGDAHISIPVGGLKALSYIDSLIQG